MGRRHDMIHTFELHLILKCSTHIMEVGIKVVVPLEYIRLIWRPHVGRQIAHSFGLLANILIGRNRIGDWTRIAIDLWILMELIVIRISCFISLMGVGDIEMP